MMTVGYLSQVILQSGRASETSSDWHAKSDGGEERERADPSGLSQIVVREKKREE
jgi:hypothetical protein